MRLLLTGSTGFVGTELLRRLHLDGLHDLAVISRRQPRDLPSHIGTVHVAEIGADTDFGPMLAGVDVIIHAAALAHRIDDSIDDPVAVYRKANTDTTLNLARQAANAGVKRMIFLSTIGVHGNITQGERLTENSPIAPHSAYALSKYEAELGLRALEKDTGMEVSIIRPPLIYGENPPGNLEKLLKLVSRGLPLPFGLIRNKRTLVSLKNIVDLIICCVQHPKAGGETVLAGDAVDVSTPEIIALIAEGMNTKIIQIPVPSMVLKIGAHLLGRAVLYQQLCGSLQIDITKSRHLLGWTPVASPHDDLIAMGRRYRENVGLK